MIKYYTYHEPGEDEVDIQVILPLRQILYLQSTRGDIMHRSYISAREAILDWIIVHWAYPCTKEGEFNPSELI